MIECLIIGDSIAVGTAQFRTECVSKSVVGITSRNWNKTYGNKITDANTTVISLGSNDYVGIKTYSELKSLREKIKSKYVFWIVPAINTTAQNAVIQVAKDNNDKILFITKLSKDGIHPTTQGYKELSEKTK